MTYATPDNGAEASGHGRFLAVVKRDGLMPYVEVPEDVGAGFKGAVPVVGTIGRARFRSTIEPGAAGYRLFVDANIRVRAGIAVGDRVRVVMQRDGDVSESGLPAELEEGLAGNAAAHEAFAGLPAGSRREILLALKWAKTPAARARYVKKLVRRLERGWVS